MNNNYVNEIVQKLSHSGVKLHFYEAGEHIIYDGKKILADVMRVVKMFRKKGFTPGTRVGIVGANSYKWVALDLACLAYGLSSVGMDKSAGHNIERLQVECELEHIFFIDNNQELDDLFDKTNIQENIEDSVQLYSYASNEPIGLKFTSGSTGHVKALELQSMSVNDTLTNVQTMFDHGNGDRILVFLPLYLYQQRFWIYSGILFDHEVIVVPYRFAVAAMQRLHPTVVMGVPEFFEGLAQNIDVNDENSKELFKKMLGNNIRYLWSGSAPLSIEALLKYKQLDIPLFQGYGMNETCIVSKNYPGNNKTGSVGKVVPSKSIVLDEAGQILVRSKHEVTNRYLNVSENENKEIFHEDGYVATGDIGYLDEDGYLYITGRIKDIIVLASGKKVAPIPIEKSIEKSPAVERAVVFGNGRSYLTAVLVRNSYNVSDKDISDAVAESNLNRAAEERVMKYVVCDESMSQENGLLTSQFKVRRNAVWNKYGNDLMAFYES